MRSVSSRHFFGGFVGGFLAIMLFGWLGNFLPAVVAPFLIPVGAVIGFTLGFTYELLWAKAKIAAEVLSAVGYFALIILLGLIRLAFEIICWPWTISKKAYATGQKASQRLKASPLYRMRILQALAVVVFVAVNTPLWGLLHQGNFSIVSVFVDTLMAIGIFANTLVVFRWGAVRPRYALPRTVTERNLDRYRTTGGTKFFLVTLGRLFKAEIPVAIFLAATVPTKVILALPAIYLTAVVAMTLIALMILCLRELLNAMKESSPWMSLAITIATGSGMAWVLRNHLSGTELWLSALATATLSGVACEAIRRLVGQRIAEWKITTWSQDPIPERIGKWILSPLMDAHDRVIAALRPYVAKFGTDAPI